VDDFTPKHPLENSYLQFSRTLLASTEAVKLFQHGQVLNFTSMAAKRTNTTAAS